MRYSGNLLQRPTIYRFNYERHPIQDDFHAGRQITRQPRGKSGKKSLGSLKLDTSGFADLEAAHAKE